MIYTNILLKKTTRFFPNFHIFRETFLIFIHKTLFGISEIFKKQLGQSIQLFSIDILCSNKRTAFHFYYNILADPVHLLPVKNVNFIWFKLCSILNLIFGVGNGVQILEYLCKQHFRMRIFENVFLVLTLRWLLSESVTTQFNYIMV